MRDNIRTILFTIVLAVVCSAMLVGATLFTASYRRANEKAEEVRNFLTALEVHADIGSDANSLLDLFDRYVKIKKFSEVTFYEYVPEGSAKAVAVAVPFSGMGLWGPVKGVLALEPDLQTIQAVRFYQQEETPGLGGEIGSDWFQEQFKGKQIMSNTGDPGFKILKPGSSADKNSVDGISGATMTSDRIETMLDKLIKQIAKERKNYVQ